MQLELALRAGSACCVHLLGTACTKPSCQPRLMDDYLLPNPLLALAVQLVELPKMHCSCFLIHYAPIIAAAGKPSALQLVLHTQGVPLQDCAELASDPMLGTMCAV